MEYVSNSYAYFSDKNVRSRDNISPELLQMCQTVAYMWKQPGAEYTLFVKQPE